MPALVLARTFAHRSFVLRITCVPCLWPVVCGEQVMQRARRTLQKSEDLRKGAVEYDTGKPGVLPLKGGERFAKVW